MITVNLMGNVSVPRFGGDMVHKMLDATLQKSCQRIAGHVLREAKANAPVSPTQAEIDEERERKRKEKSGGRPKRSKRETLKKTRKAKRSKRSRKNRPTPGGLEKSIHAVVEGQGRDTRVAVFVRDPSAATAYADYIHNQKGVKWHNRGIGTRNKGERADEKFIERAVRENEARYFQLIKRAVDDTLRTDRG